MNIFRITYFINLIMATMIMVGCSVYKDNLYKKRKTPVQNRQYLQQDNNITEKPNVATQYGYYNQTNENKLFYNSLLTDKKKNIAIQDEVAKNNIPDIKKTINEYQNIKKEQKPKKQENDKREKFYLQVGAYAKINNATNMQSELKKYGNVIIKSHKQNKQILNKVQIGPYYSLKQILKLQKKLKKEGHPKTLIIKNPQLEPA